MIKNLFHWQTPSWWCKVSTRLLAFSWCLGMLLGMLAATAASDTLIPMMRRAVYCPVSIPGLLAATVLPFLFSAYAVSLSEPWLLLIISALKAFSFAFCACGVSLAFGQSGWLVRFLFLFSDCCLIPVLFLYWIRHISGKGNGKRWELPVCIGAALLIGCIDYCFVAPFLVSLL